MPLAAVAAVGAVATAGASVDSGNRGADTAADAAGQSADVQRETIALNREIFEQGRIDQAPARVVGSNALAAMASLTGTAPTPYFSGLGINAFSADGTPQGVAYQPGQFGEIAEQHFNERAARTGGSNGLGQGFGGASGIQDIKKQFFLI